jgi:hypothetical protein
LQLLAPYGAFASADTLTLITPDGAVADRTPPLRDGAADGRVWYRTDHTWRFGRPAIALTVTDGETSSTDGCAH